MQPRHKNSLVPGLFWYDVPMSIKPFQKLLKGILVVVFILVPFVSHASTWGEVRPGAFSFSHTPDAVASDDDGSNFIVIFNTLVFTSADGGLTWTERDVTGSALGQQSLVASDADGTNLVVAERNGRIYTSTNSGANWTERQPAGDVDESWSAVASDADGSFLVVAADSSGRLYTSTDGGANWTERQPAGNFDLDWATVASDDDGTNLIAGIGSASGRLYTSSDSGVNWTQRQPAGDVNRVWKSVASDADGTHLFAGISSGSNGRLYTSTDSGANWTERQPAGNTNKAWWSLDSSADGAVLIAAVNTGFTYTSTDSGANWTQESGLGTNGIPRVAVAADGSNFIAGSGYALYVSPDIVGPLVDSASTQTSNDGGTLIDGVFTVAFNEDIATTTGDIVFYDASDDSVVETVDIAGPYVTLSGTDTLIIDPTTVLATGTAYYILVDAGSLEDSLSNPSVGITDPTLWDFTTDGDAPLLSFFDPADDATDIALDEIFDVYFNEDIATTTGNIVLYDASDDSVVETMNVGSSTVTFSSASQLTIDPLVTLDPGVEYYFLIDAGAITDVSGNEWSGISDPTVWSFTTDGGPAVSGLVPEDDATGVALVNDGEASSFEITFDQNVVVATGDITLHLASDDSIVETFDVTNGAVVSVSGAVATLLSGVVLEPETDYYFLIDAGTFESDATGIPFAGVTDPTAWNFTAIGGPVIQQLSPEDNATGVALGSPDGEWHIQFDQSVTAGTGNITLYKASDDSVVGIFDVADGDVVSFSDENVYIYSDVVLDYETAYYFLIDVSAIAGFDGITDPTAWNFTTVEPVALTFERVSVSDEVAEGDSGSQNPSLSSDGRYVAFESYATNLVVGDTNGTSDIFVYDRTLDTIERVSLNSEGEENVENVQASGISGDGRFVTFTTSGLLLPENTEGVSNVFVYDRDLDELEFVSKTDLGVEGNTDSYKPSISSDGRYVAFESSATNLVADDTNGYRDVFIYDRTNDTIERVSFTLEGEERDSPSNAPSISNDGRYVTYDAQLGDSDSYRIFLYDRDTDSTEVISLSGEEELGNIGFTSNSHISADARFVVFISRSTNLTEDVVNGNGAVFLRDRTLGTTALIGIEYVEGNGYAGDVALSADGQHVVYSAYDESEENLHVYRYDTETNTELLITEGVGGADGYTNADSPTISNDGSIIAFTSENTDLVAGDTNGVNDIFVVGIPEDEEEPESEEEEEDEGGSSSGHRHGSDGASFGAGGSGAVLIQLQLKLIELLKQLLQELIKAQVGTL